MQGEGGRKLAAVSLQACLATGGAKTAFPGSSDYNNARIEFNLRQLYNPAAFVFPTTVAQVQNAVSCSIQAGVGVVPRGGGHSFEDYSLGMIRLLTFSFSLFYFLHNWNVNTVKFAK